MAIMTAKCLRGRTAIKRKPGRDLTGRQREQNRRNASVRATVEYVCAAERLQAGRPLDASGWTRAGGSQTAARSTGLQLPPLEPNSSKRTGEARAKYGNGELDRAKWGEKPAK